MKARILLIIAICYAAPSPGADSTEILKLDDSKVFKFENPLYLDPALQQCSLKPKDPSCVKAKGKVLLIPFIQDFTRRIQSEDVWNITPSDFKKCITDNFFSSNRLHISAEGYSVLCAAYPRDKKSITGFAGSFVYNSTFNKKTNGHEATLNLVNCKKKAELKSFLKHAPIGNPCSMKANADDISCRQIDCSNEKTSFKYSQCIQPKCSSKHAAVIGNLIRDYGPEKYSSVAAEAIPLFIENVSKAGYHLTQAQKQKLEDNYQNPDKETDCVPCPLGSEPDSHDNCHDSDGCLPGKEYYNPTSHHCFAKTCTETNPKATPGMGEGCALDCTESCQNSLMYLNDSLDTLKRNDLEIFGIRLSKPDSDDSLTDDMDPKTKEKLRTELMAEVQRVKANIQQDSDLCSRLKKSGKPSQTPNCQFDWSSFTAIVRRSLPTNSCGPGYVFTNQCLESACTLCEQTKSDFEAFRNKIANFSQDVSGPIGTCSENDRNTLIGDYTNYLQNRIYSNSEKCADSTDPQICAFKPALNAQGMLDYAKQIGLSCATSGRPLPSFPSSSQGTR